MPQLPDQISIHALREEGDRDLGRFTEIDEVFLSTPSARRATAPNSTPSTLRTVFLSTPSARRATYAHRSARHGRADFYPRPPRGGRQLSMILLSYQFLISIHALREEGDTKAACLLHNGFYFYPRPPRGGRPRRRRSPRPAARISIHALREEGDPLPGNGSRDKRISIHALREEGDALCVLALQHRVGFLSTPSARRATKASVSGRRASEISIHALREEGDLMISLRALM